MSARIARSQSQPGVAPTSDSDLFAGMASGDLRPFGELFDRHHASVRTFAERLLASPADAADLVQETFLTALRAASSFEAGSAAKPFLFGIAAQLARRRRRGVARMRAMLEKFAHVPLARRSTPEDQLAASEETVLLNAALALLSHDHREILLMVDLGGLSGVEAARALGIPPGTVWRRLHDARAVLSARMKRSVG